MELKRYKSFIHYSLMLVKLSKALSKRGKNHKVFNQLQHALCLYKFASLQNPLTTFLRFEKEVKVLFDLKLVKQGRHSYKVPVILEPFKQVLRFIKVFVSVIKANTQKICLTQKLFAEFWAIHKGTSSILTRSQAVHQEAFINRGFAHYRW